MKRARNAQAHRTHLAHWLRRIFRPTYTRAGEKVDSPNWCVELQYLGKRQKLSLGTPNKEAAAARARDMFTFLHANGWEAFLARYRPPSHKTMSASSQLTVGEFIAEARAVSGVEPRTIAGYAGALRTIVSDIFGLDARNKCDCKGGGHAEWLSEVNAIELADLTQQKIQKWKRAFVSERSADPISHRSARVSVNSLLVNARSLFSSKITRHLEVLPPNPFANVELEPRPSLKYRSGFDVEKLIGEARTELAENDPEAFKIFLLAVMAGLRRREIDLLEWSSFLWDLCVIRIQTTRYFTAKTEESFGDVQVDRELMDMFRGYRARATSSFVIESPGTCKPRAAYAHYRCLPVFQRLTGWLQHKGITTYKPIHTLRKEFGSLINARAGIHASSRALRHSSVAMTDKFYTDSRARVTVGLGHTLIEADSSKVTPIHTSDSGSKRDSQAR